MKNFISCFFYVLQIQSNINFIAEKIDFTANTTIQENYYQSNQITIESLNSLGLIYIDGKISAKQLSIGNSEEPNLIFFYDLPKVETLKKSLLIDSSTGQIFQSENNNILEKKYINTTEGVYNTVETNNIQPQSLEDIIIENENNLKEKISILIEAQEVDINANTIYIDSISPEQERIIFIKPIEIEGILNCQEGINSKEMINSNMLTCNTNNALIINAVEAHLKNTYTPQGIIITTQNCSFNQTPSILFLNNLQTIKDGNYLTQDNKTIFQSKNTNTALTLSITNTLETENITINNLNFSNIKNAKNIGIYNLYLQTRNNFSETDYLNSQINIYPTNTTQYNVEELSFITKKIIGPNLYIKNFINNLFGGLAIVNYNYNKDDRTTTITESLFFKEDSIKIGFKIEPLNSFTHFIVFTNTKLPGTETNIAMLSKKTLASYLEKKNTNLTREATKKIYDPIELLSLAVKIYQLLEKKKKHIVIIKKKINELKSLISKKNYLKIAYK